MRGTGDGKRAEDARALFPAWRLYVEEELNVLADVLELNAEEPWEADVHGRVVEAWAMLRDHRQASRDSGSDV